MQVPESDSVGRVGLDETKADFSRIRWGANENVHDFGTDLVIAVRDARGNELGLLVGAQVKSGSSWFSRATSPPDPEGWWFWSDQKHVDHWLNYSAPHLIVLHDNDTRTSFYEHITPQTVISTGKGSKILVPSENRIDAGHPEALLKIAGTGRLAVPLEGTAWTGATPPAEADRLRFALIVPRLVAPHPNHDVEGSLASDVALALMMQARLSEVDDEGVTRKPQQRREGWDWSLLAAFKARIYDQGADELRARIHDAPHPAGLVAATIMFASARLEEGDPDEARQELEFALAQDSASPIDHAWLCLQYARALVELGEIAEARDQADRAYSIRDVAGHDVTATAISGVAATILFNTAGWQTRNLLR